MQQPPAPPSFSARPRPRRILSVIKSSNDNSSASVETGTGAETGQPASGASLNSSNLGQAPSFRPPISATRPASVTLSSPAKRSPGSTPPPPSFRDSVDVIPKTGFTQLGAAIEHELRASHNNPIHGANNHKHDSVRLDHSERSDHSDRNERFGHYSGQSSGQNGQNFARKHAPHLSREENPRLDREDNPRRKHEEHLHFNLEHSPRLQQSHDQSRFGLNDTVPLSFESQSIAAEVPPASFFRPSQLDETNKPSASFPTDRPSSFDSLSPKSSGEAFLDAADKAADFIGDRLKDTFKMFASSPSMSLSPKSQSPVSDSDPFADILSNLKDPRPKSPAEPSPNSDRDLREELSKLSLHSTGLDAEFKSSATLKDNGISSKDSDALSKDNGIPLKNNGISSKDNAIPLKDDASLLKIHDSSLLKSNNAPSLSANQPTLKPSNLFRHGLSALERIGKTTADVVVGTRNKIIEQSAMADGLQQLQPSPSNPVVPDFTDASQSFTQVLQLYGGLAKLQATQIKSIRSGIALKFAKEQASKAAATRSSYDFNWRHSQCPKVSLALHPDHIGSLAKQLTHLDAARDEMLSSLPAFQDELICLFRLLRSLDGIFVETGSAEELIASNRRRHTLCQLAFIFNDIVNALPTAPSLKPEDVEATATALSQLTAILLRSLQDNFGRNCSDEAVIASGDQQIACKMILDMAYAIVPQLQGHLFA